MEEEEEDPCNQYNRITAVEIWAELKEMRKICLPIVASNLLSYLRGMLSVACMGRLGPLELAGGSLAVGLTNITGISVLSGLALALDPICSQASGSGNSSLASAALRRTILLLLIASVPIAVLWFSLHRILLFIRFDPEVATAAQNYTLFSLPSLLTSSLLLPLRSYLRALSRPLPLAAASAISSLALHLPLAPLLSRYLGISGIALSSSFSDLATILLLALYFSTRHKIQAFDDDIAKLQPLQPHPPVSPGADGWIPLLQLAIPSCLGVCLEWWWYELMTIAAGFLPNQRTSLAAAGIVIQTTAFLYTFPTTLAAAATVRIGNELGAGRPNRARVAAAIAVLLSIIASCFSLAWATLGRGAWARVFTSDEDVLQVTLVVLPVIGLCELANCPQTACCGVLRGCARPAVAAAVNLFSFYLVGGPVALLLAFRFDMGFLGLCLGLLAAQIVCAISILMATWNTDWDLEAEKAVVLVGGNALRKQGSLSVVYKL